MWHSKCHQQAQCGAQHAMLVDEKLHEQLTGQHAQPSTIPVTVAFKVPMTYMYMWCYAHRWELALTWQQYQEIHNNSSTVTPGVCKWHMCAYSVHVAHMSHIFIHHKSQQAALIRHKIFAQWKVAAHITTHCTHCTHITSTALGDEKFHNLRHRKLDSVHFGTL